MEVWEGAILIVGGIWLVGKLSRQSPSHPVNYQAPGMIAMPSDISGGLDPTRVTNMDGSGSLTAGEPLGLPAHPIIPTGGRSVTPTCSTCFTGNPFTGPRTQPLRPQPVGGGRNISYPKFTTVGSSQHTTPVPLRGPGATGGSIVHFGGIQPVSGKARFFAV